ncbi:hypothetical protein MGN70_009393 [Eutypa lata]|nr:hypothetical protein MGN70_009393 [Eutypa lata]
MLEPITHSVGAGEQMRSDEASAPGQQGTKEQHHGDVPGDSRAAPSSTYPSIMKRNQMAAEISSKGGADMPAQGASSSSQMTAGAHNSFQNPPPDIDADLLEQSCVTFNEPTLVPTDPDLAQLIKDTQSIDLQDIQRWRITELKESVTHQYDWIHELDAVFYKAMEVMVCAPSSYFKGLTDMRRNRTLQEWVCLNMVLQYSHIKTVS